MAEFCQLWLTCKDKAEADLIARTVLAKHLVACVKQMPVTSSFQWKGKIDNESEILLQMDSRLDLFEKIEAVVNKLHSYDTPNLQATTVLKVSKKTEEWLKGVLDV